MTEYCTTLELVQLFIASPSVHFDQTCVENLADPIECCPPAASRDFFNRAEPSLCGELFFHFGENFQPFKRPWVLKVGCFLHQPLIMKPQVIRVKFQGESLVQIRLPISVFGDLQQAQPGGF